MKMRARLSPDSLNLLQQEPVGANGHNPDWFQNWFGLNWLIKAMSSADSTKEVEQMSPSF